jgi:hypothetical protein
MPGPNSRVAASPMESVYPATTATVNGPKHFMATARGGTGRARPCVEGNPRPGRWKARQPSPGEMPSWVSKPGRSGRWRALNHHRDKALQSRGGGGFGTGFMPGPWPSAPETTHAPGEVSRGGLPRSGNAACRGPGPAGRRPATAVRAVRRIFDGVGSRSRRDGTRGQRGGGCLTRHLRADPGRHVPARRHGRLAGGDPCLGSRFRGHGPGDSRRGTAGVVRVASFACSSGAERAARPADAAPGCSLIAPHAGLPRRAGVTVPVGSATSGAATTLPRGSPSAGRRRGLPVSWRAG